jgi:hypothetical protein
MDGNIEPNLMEHKSQELPRVAMWDPDSFHP